MASNGIPQFAQAPIEKCKLCDRGEDARHYCTNCGQQMCKMCKTTHVRSTVSKDHDIISIAIEVADEAESVCSFHHGERVRMYCISCEHPVCDSCIAEITHKAHDFEKLVKIENESRITISNFITEIKQEITEFEATLQSINNNKREYTKSSEKTIRGINQHRKQKKLQIDTQADDLIMEVEKRKNKDIKTMNNQCGDLQKKIANKIYLIQSCEEKLRSNSSVLIGFSVGIRSRRQKPTTFSITDAHALEFIGNDVNVPEMFGKLQDRVEKIK